MRIICTKMKYNELKKDLELGRRPIKDMETVIYYLRDLIGELS